MRYKGSHACVLAEWVPQEFRTEIAVRNIDRIPGIGSADAQKAREADAEAEAVWRGRGLLWFENRGGRRRLEDMPEDDPASYWREFADQAIDMMARDRIALHHAAARLKIELGTLKRWVNRRRRERKNPQPVHENDPK